MARILLIAGKVLGVIFALVLMRLIGRTVDYFMELPENDKNRSLIACNVLVLIITLIFLLGRMLVG